MIEIPVNLGARSYSVWVGEGAKSLIAEHLPAATERVAIVTQESIPVEVDSGIARSRTFVIEEGEEAKSLETVEELCRGFAQMGLTRRDCVVTVGGGVVSDVGGFAAAVYHRGTNVLHVPTTLVGQIDAAIGGKTGVNIPEGKNLVGSFWQPVAVLCDIDVLATLPPRELLCGLGEVAKCEFLGRRAGMTSPGLANQDRITQVAYCAELKARVVSADETEQSRLRDTLNYGHTLGHALEIAGNFDLRHGEAVSIGVHFAALLSRRLGRIDNARVDRHLEVLTAFGLPTELPANLRVDDIVVVMGRDKKAMAGLTFVLDGEEGVEVVEQVDPEVVRETLEEMRA